MANPLKRAFTLNSAFSSSLLGSDSTFTFQTWKRQSCLYLRVCTARLLDRDLQAREQGKNRLVDPALAWGSTFLSVDVSLNRLHFPRVDHRNVLVCSLAVLDVHLAGFFPADVHHNGCPRGWQTPGLLAYPKPRLSLLRGKSSLSALSFNQAGLFLACVVDSSGGQDPMTHFLSLAVTFSHSSFLMIMSRSRLRDQVRFLTGVESVVEGANCGRSYSLTISHPIESPPM